jgi:four helix bundle protein
MGWWSNGTLGHLIRGSWNRLGLGPWDQGIYGMRISEQKSGVSAATGVDFYVLNCRVFKSFQFEMRRVGAQAVASADSVHRNIAEGYCRRSLREYLQFLNFGLGSLGESVSGLHAYLQAGQVSSEDFKALNDLAFKLENGLLKLVESLERKRDAGDWIDSLIIKESNVAYGSDSSAQYLQP